MSGPFDIIIVGAGPAGMAVAGRARTHLAKARGLRVSSAARPPLLLATLADGYLRCLHRAGFDPFAPAVQAPASGRAWRLTLAALLRRF